MLNNSYTFLQKPHPIVTLPLKLRSDISGRWFFVNKPAKQSMLTRVFKPLSIVSLLAVGLLTGCGVDRGANVNQYDGVYNVNDYTGRVNQFQGRNIDTTGRVTPFWDTRGGGTTLNNRVYDYPNGNRLGSGMGVNNRNVYDNNFIQDDRNLMNRGTDAGR